MSAPLKFAGKPRTRNFWHWLPFAVAASIVGLSVYALASRLRDVDFGQVAAHVRTMLETQSGAIQIGWAVLFIAGAYGTLTCYDFFAVRTLGARHVPYRIAALASFTSFSIGHNIGFTAVSGGAIRYRIYSQFGLGVIDVTKICFLTGLTFWLGNLAMLGTGIIWHPEVAGRVIDNVLPSGAVRAIGIVGLLLLSAYLAWASYRPRTVGIANWTVRLPSGRSTAVQIAIGLADLSCTSCAMYNLLPPSVHGEPVTIMTAFVSATLLGFASHAPGSLGVFDNAMLAALTDIPKEELVASLVVFRLLYFIIPFCLALITMALRETIMFLRRSRASRSRMMLTPNTQISDQPPVAGGDLPHVPAHAGEADGRPGAHEVTKRMRR